MTTPQLSSDSVVRRFQLSCLLWRSGTTLKQRCTYMSANYWGTELKQWTLFHSTRLEESWKFLKETLLESYQCMKNRAFCKVLFSNPIEIKLWYEVWSKSSFFSLQNNIYNLLIFVMSPSKLSQLDILDFCHCLL